MTTMCLPPIIQGGMGAGVSCWKLAKKVSERGMLGVVSGTALDSVVARRLQDGDEGGHIRRALDNFPFKEMANRFYEKFFVENGKKLEEAYKALPMPTIKMNHNHLEALILGNFVEVFLAKEGHKGVVGINYLEKIQLPNLPSIMGAMLAGVDYVLMGAGLPTYIPGVLDGLAKWEKVSMKLHVTGPKGASASTSFDPTKILPGKLPLQRPNFLAIISSEIVAKTMIKRSSGEVNGFVVENHTAGGHNAPPRKVKGVQADAFSDKDTIKIDAIAKLGKPFWLAGKFASPEKLKEAKDQGAIGVQIGTAFAFCDQSGIPAETRKEVLDQCKAGTIKIDTDFRASPTGYPFKVVRLDDAPKAHKKRQRVCDLGYLRSIHITEDEHTLYRCASEPIDHYLKKEGEVDEVLGRQCLCNALMSLIGHPQVRDGYNEPVIITAGSDVLEVVRFLKDGDSSYSADDVIDYILGESTKK